jgi:hypothetical protein
MDKEKKVFIQVQSTLDEREKLEAIAKSRGRSMSQEVRDWINRTYARLISDKAA